MNLDGGRSRGGIGRGRRGRGMWRISRELCHQNIPPRKHRWNWPDTYNDRYEWRADREMREVRHLVTGITEFGFSTKSLHDTMKDYHRLLIKIHIDFQQRGCYGGRREESGETRLPRIIIFFRNVDKRVLRFSQFPIIDLSHSQFANIFTVDIFWSSTFNLSDYWCLEFKRSIDLEISMITEQWKPLTDH